VRLALANAGTAFIKWGQWSSTRPDMFPEPLCAELTVLHSQAPTHGFRHTRRLVEEAVGATLESYFDEFDRKPFASGSIAQVHLARLKGERVAVKVRHPDVVERIRSDFALMRMLAELSAKFRATAWLNLKASVSQFSATMVAQTRLDVEAEHINRFAWNFGGWSDASFPRVLLATQTVLVETFEKGELVSKYTLERTLGVGKGQEPLAKNLAHFLVSRGEDVYLKMLLVDNLMHADLHPGNMLLQGADGALPPKLILLDLGMVARLSREESEAFIGLLNAVGDGDGRAAAKCVLAFSEEQPNAHRDEFEREMGELFVRTCRGFGTNVKLGEVLVGVLSLVRKHRVAVDANYMTLITNVLCLEGMAAALEPSYNVLDAAQPLLTAHRVLPRAVFISSLPLATRFKALRDAIVLKRSKAQRQLVKTVQNLV